MPRLGFTTLYLGLLVSSAAAMNFTTKTFQLTSREFHANNLAIQKRFYNVRSMMHCMALVNIYASTSFLWSKIPELCQLSKASLIDVDFYGSESENQMAGMQSSAFTAFDENKYVFMFLHDNKASGHALGFRNINGGSPFVPPECPIVTDLGHYTSGSHYDNAPAEVLSGVYHMCNPSWKEGPNYTSTGHCYFLEPKTNVWKNVSLFAPNELETQPYSVLFKVDENTLWISGGMSSVNGSRVKTSRLYHYNNGNPYATTGPDLPSGQKLHGIGWLNETHVVLIGYFTKHRLFMAEWSPASLSWTSISFNLGWNPKNRYCYFHEHFIQGNRTLFLYSGGNQVRILDPVTLKWWAAPKVYQTNRVGINVQSDGANLIMYKWFQEFSIDLFDGDIWHRMFKRVPPSSFHSGRIVKKKSYCNLFSV